MKITLVALGTGSDTVTVGGAKAINSCSKVICRTALAKSSDYLKNNDIKTEYLDYIFENSRNFDTLNKKLAKKVLDEAKENDVVYCVDGSVYSDNSCGIIMKKHKDVQVFESVSHGGDVLSLVDKRGGYTILSAYSKEDFKESVLRPFVLYDLDSNYMASEWKLILTEAFGDETPAILYTDGKIHKISLYQMDMFEKYDYSSVLVVLKQSFVDKERFSSDDLFDIIKALRSENGCPWDRVQTRDSIRLNLIEEAYELYDAILNGDIEGITEELGDLLLQVVFHCIFGEDNHEYSRNDVFTGICHKMISRHTHVFGKDKATTGSEALEVWEKNKGVEKGYKSAFDYVNSVPDSFPSLMRAQKIQKRAGKYGFDFSSREQIYEKVDEELNEVKDVAIINGDYNQNNFDKDRLKEEIGDLLFSVVNLARSYKIDAEEALRFSADKFKHRFEKLEIAILKDNKEMKNLSESELDKYYNEIKKS